MNGFGFRSIVELLSFLIWIAVSIVMLAFVQCSGVAAANLQSTANLSGTVIDATGAVVPDVHVLVSNNSLGLQRQTTTNDEGYFLVPLLPPGTYTLAAEMPGFATVIVNDLVLQASINSAVQIILSPKAVAESLEVKAANSLISTDGHIDITNATIKYSVGNKLVTSLPVFTSDYGRNTLGVLPFLVPGVVPTSATGSARADANRLGNQMSINGSRPTSISFNLEGGDNNDQELNQAASPLPNPDVLQEFTVITNGYQADLGRSSGGILNAIIRSGTNRFAGNLRYILVNEALNTRGFFDPRTPLDRLNTYGGQLGGPIKIPGKFDGKDRALFFVDYEGTRSGREALSNLTVLSERERAGDFSGFPEGQLPHDPLTDKRFDGDLIPKNRFDPIAKLYLDRFIPAPNDGERNFRQLLLTEIRGYQVTTRFDFRISDADNFGATYFLNDFTTDADTGTLPPGSRTITRGRSQNLIFRETHIFSDRTVNQFIGTVTRLVNKIDNLAAGATGITPEELGFTGVHPQNATVPGAPSLKIQTTDVTIVTGEDSATARTTWQIKDDLSHAAGNHTLKMGGEVRRFIQNTSIGSDNGNFLINGVNVRNPVAAFLLGVPFSYSQDTGSTRYPRQTAYYFYGMDDWRLRPNLTLNLGLRYELAPPIVDKLDQVSAFRPGEKSEQFPKAPVGLLFVGDHDPVLGTVPRGLYPTDKNNFAPRLGIAYSPRPQSKFLRALFGEDKTAFRAAAGMFYDQTLGFTLTQVSSTQPFAVTQLLDLSQVHSLANPFGSQPNPWPLDLEKRAFTGTPQLQPIDPGFRTAYTYQYNLTIQRELPWALLLEAAYVGNQGHKLSWEREVNDAAVGPRSSIANLQARRRYPSFGSILSKESLGRSEFDSFQFRLRRRFSGGLLIDGSYVFGKSMDDGSGSLIDSVTNPFRWARSAFDRTHNFVISYSYEIPSVRVSGIANSIVNGWQLSGITEFRSGLPMDIFQSADSTLTGQFELGNPDQVKPFVRFDPKKAQTIVFNGAPLTGNFFFDPNSFHQVVVNDFTRARPGTLARNLFDGPGLNLSSISLIKRFRISDSRQIVLRSDVRNLFNHTNFQTPTIHISSATFGQVLLAGPGRNIQLSLRYTF